tara:strand:+ start:215 stop:400 length:186 start_codon:yes stop_codon:yes gene_type:complete
VESTNVERGKPIVTDAQQVNFPTNQIKTIAKFVKTEHIQILHENKWNALGVQEVFLAKRTV